mmetsp:Transcript_9754/g.27590  ORF Transcript_9754/g.27590 Transcript_9754/m.27590 type:complete len:327 (+) Transcript_9754:307-1287(+)
MGTRGAPGARSASMETSNSPSTSLKTILRATFATSSVSQTNGLRTTKVSIFTFPTSTILATTPSAARVGLSPSRMSFNSRPMLPAITQTAFVRAPSDSTTSPDLQLSKMTRRPRRKVLVAEQGGVTRKGQARLKFCAPLKRFPRSLVMSALGHSFQRRLRREMLLAPANPCRPRHLGPGAHDTLPRGLPLRQGGSTPWQTFLLSGELEVELLLVRRGTAGAEQAGLLLRHKVYGPRPASPPKSTSFMLHHRWRRSSCSHHLHPRSECRQEQTFQSWGAQRHQRHRQAALSVEESAPGGPSEHPRPPPQLPVPVVGVTRAAPLERRS